jgi:hypothetical protein
MFQQRIFITQTVKVFLRASAYVQKAFITSIMSLCFSVCVSSASIGWIFVQFFTPEFYNLMINSKFGYNRTSISGMVCEDEVLFIVAGNIKSP